MKINAHVVAQAPDGSIWAAFAMDNGDTTLVMTKAEALDLAKQLTAAAESRWVHCGSCGGNGASKQ